MSNADAFEADIADGEAIDGYVYEHHAARVRRVDDDTHPIMIVLTRGEPGQAIVMSAEDAIRLAADILSAVVPSKGQQ